MKLIKNRTKNLFIQLQKERLIYYNKLIFICLVTLISGLIWGGMLTNSSVKSLANPLNNNTCSTVDQCILASNKSENNDFILEETDLKNIIEHQIQFIRDLRKIYGKNSWSRLTIILFMTIGPIKIIPVFVRLTQNATQQVRVKLAIRSFALSTSSIVAVALTSQSILNKYNISLSALITAAGIILFLISLKMLLAQYDTQANNPLPIPENPLTTLVSPLTFPTILTPQGIALVMISMTIAQRLDNNFYRIWGLIIFVMILNLICMLYARQILNFLKPTLLQVLNLILSIIQLALAISFIFSGVTLQILTINYILKQ